MQPSPLGFFAAKIHIIFHIIKFFIMDNSSESKWGGARKGSGRKKKYVKTVFFNATQEVVDILDTVEGSKADFINRCIMLAHGQMG